MQDAKQLAYIYTDKGTYLQHYSSIVAFVGGDKTVLGRDWEYSRTTMAHISRFLDSTAANTRKKIKSKEWVYDPELSVEC